MSNETTSEMIDRLNETITRLQHDANVELEKYRKEKLELKAKLAASHCDLCNKRCPTCHGTKKVDDGEPRVYYETDSADEHAATDRMHLIPCPDCSALATPQSCPHEQHTEEFDRGWRTAEAEVATAIACHEYKTIYKDKLWALKLAAHDATVVAESRRKALADADELASIMHDEWAGAGDCREHREFGKRVFTEYGIRLAALDDPNSEDRREINFRAIEQKDGE
jgi:ferredoxin